MSCGNRMMVWEGATCVLLARVLGATDGLPIEPADVSSISLSVADMSTDPATIASGPTALTVADVVFDELQIDARWSVDRQGFNFAYVLAGSVLADGGKDYNAVVTFTTASGSFPVVFQLHAEETGLA